jgi:F-box and WD-40 domain protein CDC4
VRELTKPCEAVWRVTFKDDRCVVLLKRGGKTVMEVSLSLLLLSLV